MSQSVFLLLPPALAHLGLVSDPSAAAAFLAGEGSGAASMVVICQSRRSDPQM
jgi:hypothetical protein